MSVKKTVSILRHMAQRSGRLVSATDPMIEDDYIIISPAIHIQLGMDGPGVVVEHEDDTFTFYPTRTSLKAIIDDVNAAYRAL